jgi:Holliday junction DNA helicase RuvA
MIAYLRGILVGLGEEEITLEVGAMGLRILLSSYERGRLTEADMGQELTVQTHLALTSSGNHINIILAGFLSPETYRLFTELITVPGIGVKAALQALYQPPNELIKAINDGDVDSLKRLPGIGAAKARQIISSLAGKVVLPQAALGMTSKTLTPPWDGVWATLEKFGHRRSEIETLIAQAREALPQAETVEEVIEYIYRR